MQRTESTAFTTNESLRIWRRLLFGTDQYESSKFSVLPALSKKGAFSSIDISERLMQRVFEIRTCTRILLHRMDIFAVDLDPRPPMSCECDT